MPVRIGTASRSVLQTAGPTPFVTELLMSQSADVCTIRPNAQCYTYTYSTCQCKNAQDSHMPSSVPFKVQLVQMPDRTLMFPVLRLAARAMPSVRVISPASTVDVWVLVKWGTSAVHLPHAEPSSTRPTVSVSVSAKLNFPWCPYFTRSLLFKPTTILLFFRRPTRLLKNGRGNLSHWRASTRMHEWHGMSIETGLYSRGMCESLYWINTLWH